ncbi:ankyrin repeat-containing protein At2g01680-like [Pistacia vera]|uniref:ankyrin repeat-containing protein At2g01680-like n=1 Tax=Pistacia vera TaxID=55513 RepID=UPI001262C75C|nr:ankyrin repeat-containing protein At2g01680-like [Pistacia vera]
MDSSTEDIDARHGRNAELYNALMIDENQNKVIELCSKVPDHALHILTVHDDTVLHMATYSKKSKLVLSLLEELPDNCLDKMTRQNKAGNTILHATATSDHALHVAKELLKKAPGLLGMRNNSGETALYHSARSGKTEIFRFLADKIRGYDQVSKQSFLQRGDKTTALHICVLFHHFELALQIAKDHQFLINEKDTDGLTSLQLLSLKPEAFKRKHGDGFLKKLINSGN